MTGGWADEGRKEGRKGDGSHGRKVKGFPVIFSVLIDFKAFGTLSNGIPDDTVF